MATLKMTGCMKLVSKMSDSDQTALLDRLDQYQADGVAPERAQLMAAQDMLAEIQGERESLYGLLKEQHPDLFTVSEEPTAQPSRQRGINVRNDGDNRYADLIVDGEKTMESRDSDSLRPYVGQAVGIIRTGEGPAKLIGSVKVGEPIEVGEQKFRELEAEHLVPAGSAFDIKSGRTKFLYPLTDAKRFDEERDVDTRGIVAREVQFSRARADLRAAADAIAAMDEDTRDNTEIGDFPGSADGYNLYEARKLAKKPSDKLKRVTESNSFSLWQNYDYIANVDGEMFGVTKQEDPDDTDDETKFVFDYQRLDNPDVAGKSMSDQVDELFAAMRKGGAQLSRARQTDTPEFKKWFGDSKVVDADGKPLVVYHGTEAKFSAFDGPAFFTDNSDEATEYGSAVIAAYVRISRPKRLDSFDQMKAMQNDEIERYAALGYDGFIGEGAGGTHYVVFRPEQIKSATGNSGQFDPANPNITKSPRRNMFGQQAPAATWLVPDDTYFDRNVIFQLQDKQVDLKRVIASIKTATGGLADKWDAYLQEELYHGRAATATKAFASQELRPLLEDMQSRGVSMADFEEFLHNRHAEERNDQIAKINAAMPDGGSGIDTADARAYLAALTPAKRRAFDALAARADAITAGTRRLLVASGLETQDTINKWESAYGSYVPLMREDLDYGLPAGSGTGQGFSVRGSSSRRATGSSRPVVDIMANLAMQRERVITRAEKTRVGTALYGLAVQNPNTDFWLAVDPVSVKDPAKTIQDLVNLGINPIDAKNIIEEPKQTYLDPKTGLVTQRVNPSMRSADNVLAVRVNGEDRFVFFNNNDERAKRMSAALKNLDGQQLNMVLGASAVVSRYFASINTQYNPVFGAVNVLRDIQGAAFNLSTTAIADKKAEVLGGVPGAAKGIYQAVRATRKGRAYPPGSWAQLWDEFQAEGGQTGFRDLFKDSSDRAKGLESELNKISEGTLKQAGRAVFDWLSDYNETLENAVRLSAYKAAKGKGLSNEQAASIAKNLTVNFNRKGNVTTQAGALYAFFNASVQGTARLAETLKGPAGKKILYGGLLLGSLQALALAWFEFDDDEPPDFIKERSLVIPTGDGKYLSLPMPLGLNVIPNTGRILTEWALSGGKDSGKRIAQITGAMLDMFNPIGNAGWSLQTLAPTAIDPLAALAENKDWSGRPIAKKDMSGTDPSPGFTRSKDTASWVSKQLSYVLNLASGGTDYKPGGFSPTPDQIDYLLGQGTGGVGREILKVSQAVESSVTGEELPTYKVPLVGRFYGDTKEQSAVSGRYYANITELNAHEREIKGRRENQGNVAEYIRENPDARLVAFANNVERDVSKLRKRKREMLEKDRPAESIKMIELQISRRMKQLNDRVEQAQETQ